MLENDEMIFPDGPIGSSAPYSAKGEGDWPKPKPDLRPWWQKLWEPRLGSNMRTQR